MTHEEVILDIILHVQFLVQFQGSGFNIASVIMLGLKNQLMRGLLMTRFLLHTKDPSLGSLG